MTRSEGERPRPLATDEASQSGGGNHKLTFYDTAPASEVEITAAYESYLALAGDDAKRWSNAEMTYIVTVHREGFLRTIAEAGTAMVATPEWKGVVKAPTFAELQTYRGDPFRGRCSRPACRERCSQCIRAAAIQRNLRRFGTPDYPGANRTANRNGAREVA